MVSGTSPFLKPDVLHGFGAPPVAGPPALWGGRAYHITSTRLRPLCHPLRFVVCNVDFDSGGHLHFLYGDNTDPFHENVNAAGIHYAMCGHQVVNDIPTREAIASSSSSSNNNPQPPLVFKPRCARRWDTSVIQSPWQY